jgi:hypothetical protein
MQNSMYRKEHVRSFGTRDEEKEYITLLVGKIVNPTFTGLLNIRTSTISTSPDVPLFFLSFLSRIARLNENLKISHRTCYRKQ